MHRLSLFTAITGLTMALLLAISSLILAVAGVPAPATNAQPADLSGQRPALTRRAGREGSTLRQPPFRGCPSRRFPQRHLPVPPRAGAREPIRASPCGSPRHEVAVLSHLRRRNDLDRGRPD